MDPTKELTKERTPSVGESERLQVAARESSLPVAQLDRLTQVLLQGGQELSALGELLLEGAVEAAGFERGFLLLIDPEPAVAESDPGLLDTLATRVRRSSAQGDWGAVRNPELSVSRAVVKRAITCREPLLVGDCLVPPAPGSEAQHRAVACLSFELSPGADGVLYLDRAPGMGELGEAEREVLRLLTRGPLIAFQRAYALQELAAARAGDGEPSSRQGGEEIEAAEGPAIEPAEAPSFFGIVGSDEKLQKVISVVRKIKDSDLNVCIFGESGTGKELLARAIHDVSRRGQKPFVAENCGAIPENLLESELFGHVKGAFTGADEDKKGLFETADGGTLFLDEIGDMSETMQRKLLRVLQEGVIRPIGSKQTVKVDVRVICASNRDLKVLVQKNAFRADLYYRLNVITLELPPLRDRPADVPPLVGHLASKICEEEGVKRRFSQSAMRAFCEYPWPGNIRELRNVLRRVIITCQRRVVARKDVMGYLTNLGASPRSGENLDRDDRDLILRVPVRDSFNAIIEECERVVLLNALKQCAWNKSRVTKTLKIPRQSLYNKIAKYKLEKDWGAAGQEPQDEPEA